MKRIIGFFIIIIGLTGCGKENEFSNDFASVVFINAAPAPSATLPGIGVYVDTMVQGGALAFRSNSTYLSVRPGTRNIEFRGTINFRQLKLVDLPSVQFTTNTASSVFIYDTLGTSNQNMKALRLSDDLTLAPTGSIKVRFVPLASNAGPMDITFLRTNVTPNDSVTLVNKSYVGASPAAGDVQALSAFTTIPLGTYSIKLKSAGTQTVMTSASANLNGTTGFTGIYTLYSAGTAQGLPLSLNLVNHYR